MTFIAILIFMVLIVAPIALLIYLKRQNPDEEGAGLFIQWCQQNMAMILLALMVTVTICEAGIAATTEAVNEASELNPVVKIFIHIAISLLQFLMSLAITGAWLRMYSFFKGGNYGASMAELVKSVVALTAMVACPLMNLYVTANVLQQIPVLDVFIYGLWHNEIETFNHALNLGFDGGLTSPIASLAAPLLQMVFTVTIHLLISLYQSVHSFTVKVKQVTTVTAADPATNAPSADHAAGDQASIERVLKFFLKPSMITEYTTLLKEAMDWLEAKNQSNSSERQMISLGLLASRVDEMCTSTTAVKDADVRKLKDDIFELFTKAEGDGGFDMIIPSVSEVGLGFTKDKP